MDITSSNNQKDFVSDAVKRTYSVRVGLTCGIILLLQFVIPFLVMLPVWLSFPARQNIISRHLMFNKSVLWQGDIWYLEESWRTDIPEHNAILKKVTPQHKQKPITVAEIPVLNPWLISAHGKLWIVSSTHIGTCEGDTVVMRPVPKPLGEISSPFIFDNKLAVLEGTPSGVNLVVADGYSWGRKQRLNLDQEGDSIFAVNNYRVITTPEEIYLFHQLNRTLFYRTGLSLTANQDSWNLVGPIDYYYFPTVVDGKPSVFTTRHSKLTDTENLVGLQIDGSEWKNIVFTEQPSMEHFAVFPLASDEFLVFTESFRSGLHSFVVKNDKMMDRRIYVPQNFFPLFFVFMFVFSYVIMVLMVSALMKRFRSGYYEYTDKKMKFATLSRRAFAYVIDMLIMSIPLAVMWIIGIVGVVKSGNSGGNDTLVPVIMSGMMLVGFGLAIAFYFLYSYLEGKNGQTPGKRLLKIKVLGTDLQPCGFGRALLRNLLLLVDGSFNNIVGVAVIAYTEHWQRIGDMAARTIVVESPANHGPIPSP